MEEKLCLKWNEFQENMKSTFGELRGDKDFTDVTLACEDQQFEVHKFALASCSSLFKKMLVKIKTHQHPLIYFNGINAMDLEVVLDFIYFGEVKVYEEDLDRFLRVAEELQLKGLEGNNGKPPIVQLLSTTEEIKPKSEIERKPIEKDFTSSMNFGKPVSTESRTMKQFPMDTDTATVVASMIKKQGNVYKCSECDFQSRYTSHLKEHVQKHIEGLEFPCKYCEKVMRSSAALRMHINKNHQTY